MQRVLAHARSPASAVPLRFLLAAPWFGVVAALALLAAGQPAFASRWTAPMLGTTHLLTLGYLGMAMTGSMLQLIPVVTGATVPVDRHGAAVLWCALALGTLLLASALGLNQGALLLPGAALLAGAFIIVVAVAGAALVRRAGAAAMPMVRGMRLALAGLCVTVSIGVALALLLTGAQATARWLPQLFCLPLPQLVDLHAAWGLLGWVAMLVVGVGFQVIPLFQSTRDYPASVARWGTWSMAGLLAAWTLAAIGGGSGAVPAALLAAVLIVFAAYTAWLLTRQKRKAPDVTTLYWRLALGSLAAAALLHPVLAMLAMLPAQPQAPLLLGIVFIVGFAMSAVNGMLYKIVPFLLWYHLQQDPRAAKGAVPSIRLILPDTQGQRQFRWHAAALAALLGAALWPHWLARPAAALLAVACTLLALDLARAARQCSRIRRSFQPS